MQFFVLLLIINALLTIALPANAQDNDNRARFSSYITGNLYEDESRFVNAMFALCKEYESSYSVLDRLIIEGNPEITRSKTEKSIRYTLPPLDFHRARQILLEINVSGENISSCAASLGRVIYHNVTSPEEK